MKQIEFKTVADFKRQARVGRYLKGGYYEKGKSTEWREIIAVQSNGLSLKTDNASGRSFLDFPKAKDCEIEDGVLKIYQERAKIESSGVDVPADVSWLKWDIENGRIDPKDVVYYRTQIAEYILGEE